MGQNPRWPFKNQYIWLKAIIGGFPFFCVSFKYAKYRYKYEMHILKGFNM